MAQTLACGRIGERRSFAESFASRRAPCRRFFKSRTAQELGRRVDVLVRLVEKEFEEEQEEDLKRQKDVAKGGRGGKRAHDGAGAGTSAKKQRGGDK